MARKTFKNRPSRSRRTRNRSRSMVASRKPRSKTSQRRGHGQRRIKSLGGAEPIYVKTPVIYEGLYEDVTAVNNNDIPKFNLKKHKTEEFYLLSFEYTVEKCENDDYWVSQRENNVLSRHDHTEVLMANNVRQVSDGFLLRDTRNPRTYLGDDNIKQIGQALLVKLVEYKTNEHSASVEENSLGQKILKEAKFKNRQEICEAIQGLQQQLSEKAQDPIETCSKEHFHQIQEQKQKEEEEQQKSKLNDALASLGVDSLPSRRAVNNAQARSGADAGAVTNRLLV